MVWESCMGLWVGTNLRKQSISTQLPRRNPGQEVSRQSWLVAILNFLTSPFPFEHQCPTEIREITHCYNFLGRWVCLSWDQDRHTQKPLTGIGAKLFDGAGRNFAGSRPGEEEARRSGLHCWGGVGGSVSISTSIWQSSWLQVPTVSRPYPPLRCAAPRARLKVTAVNMWWRWQSILFLTVTLSCHSLQPQQLSSNGK